MEHTWSVTLFICLIVAGVANYFRGKTQHPGQKRPPAAYDFSRLVLVIALIIGVIALIKVIGGAQ